MCLFLCTMITNPIHNYLNSGQEHGIGILKRGVILLALRNWIIITVEKPFLLLRQRPSLSAGGFSMIWMSIALLNLKAGIISRFKSVLLGQAIVFFQELV